MSSSERQFESRVQFSPIPQEDIEQGHEQNIQDKEDDNNNNVDIEPCEEGFDMGSVVIILRLALVGTLLIGLALSHRSLYQPSSDSNIPPRFFLESFHVPQLKISDGELSSTWNLTLTISNPMNSSTINILRLDAAITYKGNETLVMVTPIVPVYASQLNVFPVGEEEKKKLVLNFNITGWEKDQPVVDDTVIQAIVEDMKSGVTRFGLRLRAVGEVVFGDGWISGFDMSASCNDLEVRFLMGEDQKKEEDEAAALVDGRPRECVGGAEWGPATDSM